MYGNSIPQHWGSDNKGPLTVGLSTGANRNQVARRTHVTCPQATGRNIQGDEIFQIGWGKIIDELKLLQVIIQILLQIVPEFIFEMFGFFHRNEKKKQHLE